MKSLLILVFLSLSVFSKTPQLGSADKQRLEMQLSTEFDFQKMVKVYDYSGNFLKEYPLQDVVNNDISVMDHFALEQSDFAFSYLGDYYYFSEELSYPVSN